MNSPCPNQLKKTFLIILIAKKIRIFKMADFRLAAILDCILPPYSHNLICLCRSQISSRVHTARKCNQNHEPSKMYVLNDCLVLATFSINQGAILNFDRKEISYAEINVRNEFPMLKLVEYDFLIILIAQKIRILKMSDFRMAAILDRILTLPAPGSRCLPD